MYPKSPLRGTTQRRGEYERRLRGAAEEEQLSKSYPVRGTEWRRRRPLARNGGVPSGLGAIVLTFVLLTAACSGSSKFIPLADLSSPTSCPPESCASSSSLPPWPLPPWPRRRRSHRRWTQMPGWPTWHRARGFPSPGILPGLPSQCGGLTLVSAEPDQDRVIAGVANGGLWASVGGSSTWDWHLGIGAGSLAEIDNRPSSITYDPDHPGTFWGERHLRRWR